jgi:signal peptidase I
MSDTKDNAQVDADNDAMPVWKQRMHKLWREWFKPILIIVVVLSTLRSAIADWNDVPTGSMRPTILEGDRIFVNKLAYDLKVPFTTYRVAEWSAPQRGDIVVLFSPEGGTRLVKRVIGIPGDHIELRDKDLFINDQRATYAPPDQAVVDQLEPAEQIGHMFKTEIIDGRAHPLMWTASADGHRSFTPITLGEDEYFVMGDNRDNSRDSRIFGVVDRSRIVGRTSAVAFSVDRDNYYLPRWDRFFHSLP